MLAEVIEAHCYKITREDVQFVLESHIVGIILNTDMSAINKQAFYHAWFQRLGRAFGGAIQCT